ncbi:MAG: exonuclease SbcCD subunit D [Lachnospiraceae bacterium]|nr:exonuclease SbcCD subunit D [Lachnospiraceae bacterium]
MKFLHTGDLHIGKTVNEFSMIEEQKYVLKQIIEIAVDEKADAVVIAGDVYDRPIPPTEAVELLDNFLTTLLEKKIPVIMISGNHDSGERVAFADKILEKQGLYIAGGYEGALKRVVLTDEWGEVDFVCMPFVKPAVATVENMLAATPMTMDLLSRHVLVTHYFVTGENGDIPQLSDSESRVSVGGLDNVEAGWFAAFDYVALGHIHKRQKIGAREVWYAGSPVKYSFSEANQIKSVNLVTMGRKGDITVEARELKPIHDMRIIKGELENLISPAVVAEADCEDYIKAILTNEEELIDPIGTLRSVYPNTMQIEIAKNASLKEGEYLSAGVETKKTTGELFADFYELLKGEGLDEKRRQVVAEIEEQLQ